MSNNNSCHANVSEDIIFLKELILKILLSKQFLFLYTKIFLKNKFLKSTTDLVLSKDSIIFEILSALIIPNSL